MPVWTVPASVVSVVDGDTVHLILDLGWHVNYGPVRVRISRINAPELSTPDGVVARDFAATLLPAGLRVVFASHSLDKYGRPLGTLTLPDGQDFAQIMLDTSHAIPMGD